MRLLVTGYLIARRTQRSMRRSAMRCHSPCSPLLTMVIIAFAALCTACNNEPLYNDSPLQDDTDKPLTGKIIFSAKRDGSDYHQIYTVNANGSDLQQITSFTDINAYHPSWSPGRDEIVFQSDTEIFRNAGAFILYRIAADGSGLQRVKKDSLSFVMGSRPVWSPVGDMLAYFTCPRSNCRNLWVRDMEQGWAQGFGRGAYPAWSSDGAMLAVTAYDAETELMQVFIEADFFRGNFLGVRLTMTFTDKQTPVWSPDDSRIAFISGSQIMIHDLNYREDDELTPVDNPDGREPFELHAWVADENAEYLLATFEDKANLHYRKYYLYAVYARSGELSLIVPDSTLRGADWHMPQ